MKKWIGPILSLLLIVVMISLSGSFINLKQRIHENRKGENLQIVPTQGMEGRNKTGEMDSYYIQILKQVKDRVDVWLKSLNSRIENEDITRFEVRFLEILRNILEWVKGKIDAQIESSEKKKPERKKRGGLLRETHKRISPIYEKG